MARNTPAPVDNILACIGNTPMVRLSRVTEGLRTPVYAKCEFMNPGSSVKDRIGLAIIEAAEQDGSLRPGGMIVEATSGNTGVGLALAAAIRGYRCVFTIPDKMSMEKVKLLKAFGAQVVVTPTVPPDHDEYYVTVAKRMTEQHEGAILANQFYNQANPTAHYKTTGPEIWEQTAGRLSALVLGAGTGGTVTGCGRYLKEQDPNIRIVVADPVGSILCQVRETGQAGKGQPYKVEGIGSDKIPATLDLGVIDEVRQVSDRDAFVMARRLVREEALFVGGSSGLAAVVAVQLAREIDDPSAPVVVILTDTGERYLSKLHSDEWMAENRFLERESVKAKDVLSKKPGPHADIISTTGDRSLRQVLGLMNNHGVTQIPVIERGECVGSIHENAVMTKVLEDQRALDATVSSMMSAPFPVVHEFDPMDHVLRLFTRENEAVLVKRAGEIRGILTRYDVIQHLSGR